MYHSLTEAIRATVSKGDIRNTILRQIKILTKAMNLLTECRNIKAEEILIHKPKKVKALKKQINIIDNGIKHLKEALTELEKYKETSTERL